MTKEKLKKVIITGCLFLLFILFTVAVEIFNTGEVLGSEIGFSTINMATQELFPYNENLETFSSLIGVFVILVGLGLAGIGVYQLIKTKSIKKVDKEILFAGGAFVLIAVIYVFFELVVINCRPVLIDGELEASYPSSHTLLAVVVMGIAIVYAIKKITNRKILVPVVCGLSLVGSLAIITRFLSGAHWLTDIIGSIILGLAIVTLYILSIDETSCKSH